MSELEVEEFNEEESLDKSTLENVVVYSRDWTVDTIIDQIKKGNIDLKPSFQRRNAWKDNKRSRLIESLILDLPVPEIVLAEDMYKKKSFIIIDGKQRLQTLAGLFFPETYEIWTKSKFFDLTVLQDLNGVKRTDFFENEMFEDYRRQLSNADIRCTVISNYSSTNVLYDIFHRLNTGSTPLSSQELRQVLNVGEFSDFLIQVTDGDNPIRKILGINKPDNRLIDAEILLRSIVMHYNARNYTGSQKQFLDDATRDLNQRWSELNREIIDLKDVIFMAIENLVSMLGLQNVGKRVMNRAFQPRLNKIVLELQLYYEMQIVKNGYRQIESDKYIAALFELFDDAEFVATVESTTKSKERYYTRFKKYSDMLNSLYDDILFVNPISI